MFARGYARRGVKVVGSFPCNDNCRPHWRWCSFDIFPFGDFCFPTSTSPSPAASVLMDLTTSEINTY
eukprot:COSAG01_NODE_1170_length_11406_cov_17.917662_1_plen_67_part_00